MSEPEESAPRAERHKLDPDALAALEEQRDFLLASLRDLEREHDAGDIDEDDYLALKDDYTARAASVIRAVESGRARFRSTRTKTSPAKIGAVVGALVLFAVAIGVVVAQSSGERDAGENMSGDIRLDSRQKLADALSLSSSDPLAALKLYDEVLAEDPANVEALTYRGWLSAIVARSAAESGAVSDEEIALLMTRASDSLDDAVEIDPAYPDARVFRASVRLDLGDAAGAQADLDALDELGDSTIPDFMAPLVDNLRAQVDAAAGAGGPTTTAAAG